MDHRQEITRALVQMIRYVETVSDENLSRILEGKSFYTNICCSEWTEEPQENPERLELELKAYFR